MRGGKCLATGQGKVPGGVLHIMLHLSSIYLLRSENKKINENSLTYINA
ncbi:hypothetical protein NBG4_680012 [Candidatus Sulfobium mesophilum]|uniref:Uncharacterized protein n=1 Tax=Candidatus Sulfobium mesophilum TaxID=2016548 RepID=A0A2U3QK00_9BACT|nr:hypothetical protein NBG4_680012 [Candidatus Sulfobium mesophilum]